MAWVANVRWPGWTARAGRALRPPAVLALRAACLTAAVLLGLCLDSYVGAAATAWVGPRTALLAPLWAWFRGPTLTRDLFVVLPFVAIALADGLQPGSLRPSQLWRRFGAGVQHVRPWTSTLVALLPLLLGWTDVILGTAGAPGRWVLEARAGLGGPQPAQPVGEPDLRVPALAWWLATGLMAVQQARRADAGGRRWLLVPLVAGVLAAAARPAAVVLAVPAFVATSGAAVLLTWRAARRAGRAPGPTVLPLVEKIALMAILGVALSLRWTPEMAKPLGSDAGGYFRAARDFHTRVDAEQTNPIALAYLTLHPASREPMFILITRGVFDLLGESPLHQRYLTVLASVGCVGLTYRFGRLALGSVAGLGAGLMMALETWHIEFSREGLREECALLFVYGLALLLLLPRRGGWARAVLAGALAGAAALTRLDAAAAVVFLLLLWSVRLWPAWRRAALSWSVFALLLAPLLLGYYLRTGQALAPLDASMGGDIRASMTPLLGGDIPPLDVLRYLVVGTVEVYRGSVFSGIAAHAGPGAGLVLAVTLTLYAVGLLWLLWRGPRLPAVLSLLGTYFPPFAYIAGILVLGGPGSGYTDRYTYLILPATLAVCSWAAGRLAQTASRLVTSRLRGTRGVIHPMAAGSAGPHSAPAPAAPSTSSAWQR